MRLANNATPEAKVVGEWDPDYWKHEPWRDPQHMAVVQDQWRTRCACSGCPECATELAAAAQAAGWVWTPVDCWGDAVCQGCDVLVCEQPRQGLWRKADQALCGHCVKLA